MSNVPAEPILIGGHSVYVKFFAMPRQIDDPKRVEGTFTLVGAEGVLTLDALVGPQGDPGEPSPIIRPEWGSPVTDPVDLPDPAVMTADDTGRAWYISGEWHVYDEAIGVTGGYRIIQGSVQGPPGVTPNISFSAQAVDYDSTKTFPYAINVTESGTTDAPHFSIDIPARPGPAGPAAAIRDALDFDDTTQPWPPATGATIIYDPDLFTGNGGWKPGNPTVREVRQYSLPHNGFTDYDGSAGRQLIGQLNIPAQDHDVVPHVSGHAMIEQGLLSTAQVEIEVRMGITGASTGETEQLVGLGPYDPIWSLFDAATVAHIKAHYSDTANPDRSVAAGTGVAVMSAGNPITFYVFTHKIGGSGSYKFTKAGSAPAQLVVDLQPA